MEKKKDVSANNLVEKLHPWRMCPQGMHFVREHLARTRSGKKNPNGMLIVRNEHCALNPSKKDILTFHEIQAISEKYFKTLTGAPNLATGDLKEFPNADKFDSYIRGWVHYWNDIFKPADRLDPNLIKALITTESGFREKTDISAGKQNGRARGLIQIIDPTWRVLRDHKGELKDHLILISRDELFDPSANICGGIRWLFWKKRLAAVRLKREVSWEEAIAEYKGYMPEILSGKNPNPTGMDKLRYYYSLLQAGK